MTKDDSDSFEEQIFWSIITHKNENEKRELE